MVASILIIVFSVVLFAYWFRYTCLMILRTSTTENFADRVATANRLSFLNVEHELKSAAPNLNLEPLHLSLERDFQVLNYLREHAAGLGLGLIEHRILTVDYKVMQVWYNVARKLSPVQS